MGVFWHVAVFKKQDEINMQDVIRQLVEDGNEFKIVPEECSFYDCEAGTVLCLNDFCLAFDGAAKALSQRLKGRCWCAISMMMTSGIIIYMKMAWNWTSL